VLHAAEPGLPAWPVQEVPAGWPQLLGQLADCPPSMRASPPLAALEATFQDPLRVALAAAEQGEAALRQHDLWWLSPDADVVANGPAGGPLTLFAVSPTGFLEAPTPATTFDAATAEPACVLEVPVPKSRWSPSERAAYERAHPRDRPGLRPTQRCLLGAWTDVPVYPASWSVAGLPLHQYLTATARMRLTTLAARPAVADRVPDYVPGQPLRPRLWPGPAAPLASGLADLEAEWARLHAARAPTVPAAGPVLLPCQQPRPPDYRRPASERRAATAAATAEAGPSSPTVSPPAAGPAALPPEDPGPAPPPLPPPAAPACTTRPPTAPWSRLWRLPVSNRVKVFGARLLHGSIPCNAMVAGMRAKPPSFVACSACARSPAAGATVPPETYTHLFLECPTYRPVLDWLARVWAALPQCTAPPLEASVFITAEPGAPWQPALVRTPVWHSLRLMTLRAIWSARVSGDPRRQSAAAVVASIIAAVAEEIKLQHARCCRREHHASQLPPAILAMRRLDNPPDAFAAWAAAGLCSVIGAGSPGGGQLVVLLTASWPVAAP
jgi:hypothetical protein